MLRRIASLLILTLAVSLAHAATLDEARRLAARGDSDLALASVRAVLQETPTDASARLLEGVLLSRLGRVDEAVARFKSLSEDRPELPEPYNNLAVLYAAAGDFDAAREALIQAVRLQPEYDVAHENLGDIYTQLAGQSYRQAAAANDDNQRVREKAKATETILSPLRVQPDAPPAQAAGARSTAAAATQSAAPACVTISGLSSRAQAQEVERWLDGQGIDGAFERRGSESSGGTFRVYTPPADSLSEARRTASALKDSGIKDLMVIGSGERANSISLGVYTRRANADRRVRELAARGIETRIASSQPGSGSSYVVRTMPGATTPDAGAIRKAFPGTRVSPSPCG